MQHHQEAAPTHRQRERNGLLFGLAATAGTFDAIVYLGLQSVFPANMTGNTILLGLRIGQADWIEALRAMEALAGFAAGVAVGSAIVERRQPDAVWPPAITRALAFEASVLAAVGIGWAMVGNEPLGAELLGLIFLSAGAMGIQSTSTRRLGVAGVATTAVTGTLTSFTSGLVKQAQDDESDTDRLSPTVAVQAAVWVIYVGGAVVGGVAEAWWHGWAVAIPLGAVVLVLAVAIARHHDR